MPDHLLELARKGQIPAELSVAGLEQRFGDPHDCTVRPGQIWRAAWAQTNLLVLVTAAHHTDVGAIPMTLDPPAEDAQCIVVDPSLTVFGIEATLWPQLRSDLPLRVLDSVLDELPDRLVDTITAAAASPQIATPTGTRRGKPTETTFDTAVMVRAEISDDLHALATAPALPTATADTPTPPRTLSTVLGQTLDLPALVTALKPFGLGQPEVMSLLRGKKPITPEMVDLISRLTHVDRELVAQSVQPLPVEFVAEVDHPRWRPTWRERARHDGVDEATARLNASYEMYALAARQTGSDEPDWTARLAQFRSTRHRAGDT